MIEIKSFPGTFLQTNNYIVNDKDNIILIETSADLECINNELNGRKPSAIFLTHGHWDHFFNIEKYLEAFECKIYMNKNALDKLINKERKFYADRKLDINLPKDRVVFVKDDEILKFGDLKFKVLETKGHTDCSVSFLLNNEYLFTGDTLFKDGVGRTDLPTGSDEELVRSLNKILKLDDEIIVYPGHGESTIIKDEREVLSI